MIFTFYSYKGGVGRSMALANVSQRLCERGLKTLMIDFDLEAPGLERFFEIDPKEVWNHHGLLDLLVGYKRAMAQPVGRGTRDFTELHRFIVPIYHELPSGGHLHLLPAGRREGDEQLSQYAYALRTFDWQDFYFDWGGELFFQWLTRELASRYDVVLVDSRTGVTEMGGVCAYQLADALVTFCAPNAQNVQGTRDILSNFDSPRVRDMRKKRPLNVVVIPSRVDRVSSELDEFQHEFADFQKLAPPVLGEHGVSFWDLLIPYDHAFAFKEHIVKTSEAPGLGGAFDRLAMSLALMAPAESNLETVGRALSDANRARNDTSLSLRARAEGTLTASLETGTPVEPEYDPTKQVAGFDVFLSYSRQDAQFARKLFDDLQGAGRRVFLDTTSIPPGAPFDVAIGRAIAESDKMLVLIGAEVTTAQQTEVYSTVLDRPSGQRPRIIPVLLPGSSPAVVPMLLQSHAALDLRTGLTEVGRAALLDAIDTREPKAPQVTVAELSPYPGLRAFQVSDELLMFGRDRLIDDALRRLRAHPVLTIVGPSGSGKSSLVIAGIVPRLRGERQERIAIVRPGWAPMRRFVDAVRSMRQEPTPVGSEETLDPEVILNELATVPSPLIVIDQLEELWTLPTNEERVRFSDFLSALSRDRRFDGLLILVLRADFYALASEHRGLADLVSQHQLLVGPMDRDELRQAIERPARARGVRFEPGLVDRILTDVEGTPGALPLLQLLLVRLWDDRRQGFITHESYERAGGLEFLSRTAEATFETLTPLQQEATRALFLKLVTPEGTRRAISLRELSDIERQVVDAFVQARLLVVAYRFEDGTVELAHDVLRRTWRRLGDWTDRAAAALKFRSTLRQDAEQWRQQGSKTDYLYRGQALVAASNWLRDNPELAGADEAAFIRAASARQRYAVMWNSVLIAFAAVVMTVVFDLYLKARDRTLALEGWLSGAKSVSYQQEVRTAAIVDRSGTAVLVDTAAATRRVVSVNALFAALSADGRVAAFVRRNLIELFDVQNGSPVRRLVAKGTVLCVALSRDGQEVAAGTAEGMVFAWQKGEPMLGDGHVVGEPVQSLQFDDKGLTGSTSSGSFRVALR